jgi:hypothetical protein
MTTAAAGVARGHSNPERGTTTPDSSNPPWLSCGSDEPSRTTESQHRHVFKSDGGHRVKRVTYQSARNGKGNCCVLFVGNKGCCDATAGWQAEKKNHLGLVGTPARYEYP